MAFVIRGCTSVGDNITATVTTQSPAIPAGTVAGDYMQLTVGWSGSTVTLTNPSGWTQLDKTIQTNANQATFYKPATGSDTAPTLTYSAACMANAKLVSIGGWNGVAPVHANQLGGAASTTVTYPAINPLTAGDMLIYGVTMRIAAVGLQVSAVPPLGGTGGLVDTQGDSCTFGSGSANEESAILTQPLTAADPVPQQTTVVGQSVSSNIEATVISPSAAVGLIPQQMRQRVAYQVLGSRPFSQKQASYRG